MGNLNRVVARLLPCLLLAAGCNSAPIAGYAGQEKPAQTAIVSNADNVFVQRINGYKPRSRFLGGRYVVPAGPCTLEVRYSDGQFFGVPKTLQFTALPDHNYRLNSYVAWKFHGRTIGSGGWDARLEDEADKGKGFVVETRDSQD